MHPVFQLLDPGVLARSEGLCSAVFDAPARSVSVRDGDGRLLFMNGHAKSRLGRPLTTALGTALSSVLSPDAAEEQGRYLDDVAVTGRPLCVLGAEKGTLVRTWMRRAELDGHGPAVVLSAGPVVEEDGPVNESVWRIARAECNDWGHLLPLSLREIEVMRLVGQGLSSPEVGTRLGRSVKTIENHRLSISSKLGFNNRAGLVRAALQSGVSLINDLDFAHFAGLWPRRPARVMARLGEDS